MSAPGRAAEHLLTNPSFARLSPAEAEEFLKGGEVRSFGIGEVLLREGDPGDSLLVVTAGSVSVRTGDLELAVVGPGATLGEMSLVDPGPRSATLVAVKSGTMIQIGRDEFDARLAAGDPVAIKALQSITDAVFERLVAVSQQVRDEIETPRGNVFTRLWHGLRKRVRKPTG
jgi:CRP-like cAMP-binding protein